MSRILSEGSSHRAVGKPDRLLRAAITSFCSLTRPTRREITQLEDLSAPLLARVADDTLRFVSATLSESPFAPPFLVRRLADLPPEISAPLLVRSPILGNIDLLALIGRHGIEHARVIAARRNLDQRVARVIASLDGTVFAASEMSNSAEPPRALEETPAEPAPTDERGAAAAVRTQLREIMRKEPASANQNSATSIRLRWEGDPGAFRKLRSTALTGVPALFHTALADALEIRLDRSRSIADAGDISELIVAMRALRLSPEEAFLIVQCVRPARLTHVRSISAFLDAYDAVTTDQAAMLLESWRADVVQLAGKAPDPTHLRAS